MTTETLEFQAESRQLLQLMIHSIYSSKDIFLRELISNSSDALDKLRLESLRDKELDADIADLHIALEVDRNNRTLTVRDNGIGMSRAEVVTNIGTIARSGTSEFLQRMRQAKDSAVPNELIGQFGVGFYACFMVADRVTLLTRRAGESQGTRWESDGEGSYTIETVADAPQGTSVTLRLKPEDAENHLFDYTADWKLREIVKRYSDFISWRITLEIENEQDDGGTTRDIETLNSMKALWARPRDEVDESEYHEFYKHISHDWIDPLEIIGLKAEGTFEYQALLFIPAQAPHDLFMRESRRGVQLYVKRVFIMDRCEALMPEYLRFIKGVVDAQDLSLNVSREILQQDRQIQLMRRRLVKKVLSTIKELMTNDISRYESFWAAFGRAIKEGLLNDFDNRDTLLEILSFASSHDPVKQTTLRDYVSRMNEDQQHIYYLTGESRSNLEGSPHMEAFQAKGLEVLLLTDPVDEIWVDSVPEFEGKRFQSIAKGAVDLDSTTAEPEHEQRQQDLAPLLAWMAESLRDQVSAVRLSSRLTTSAACLVGETHDLTPTLEKMYRAMGQEVPRVKRALELNPGHPLVIGLRDAHTAQREGIAEIAELLYGMALLAEGGDLTDPARFTRLLADRLAQAV